MPYFNLLFARIALSKFRNSTLAQLALILIGGALGSSPNSAFAADDFLTQAARECSQLLVRYSQQSPDSFKPKEILSSFTTTEPLSIIVRLSFKNPRLTFRELAEINRVVGPSNIGSLIGSAFYFPLRDSVTELRNRLDSLKTFQEASGSSAEIGIQVLDSPALGTPFELAAPTAFLKFPETAGQERTNFKNSLRESRRAGVFNMHPDYSSSPIFVIPRAEAEAIPAIFLEQLDIDVLEPRGETIYSFIDSRSIDFSSPVIVYLQERAWISSSAFVALLSLNGTLVTPRNIPVVNVPTQLRQLLEYCLDPSCEPAKLAAQSALESIRQNAEAQAAEQARARALVEPSSPLVQGENSITPLDSTPAPTVHTETEPTSSPQPRIQTQSSAETAQPETRLLGENKTLSELFVDGELDMNSPEIKLLRKKTLEASKKIVGASAVGETNLRTLSHKVIFRILLYTDTNLTAEELHARFFEKQNEFDQRIQFRFTDGNSAIYFSRPAFFRWIHALDFFSELMDDRSQQKVRNLNFYASLAEDLEALADLQQSEAVPFPESLETGTTAEVNGIAEPLEVTSVRQEEIEQIADLSLDSITAAASWILETGDQRNFADYGIENALMRILESITLESRHEELRNHVLSVGYGKNDFNNLPKSRLGQQRVALGLNLLARELKLDGVNFLSLVSSQKFNAEMLRLKHAYQQRVLQSAQR